MNNWYGWLIEQSLIDQSIFQLFKTVKMKSEEENWKEHIVEIPENKLDAALTWLTKNIKPSWYTHLIKGNKIIVVYKNKMFRLKRGESFSEVAGYGRSQRIVEDQLPGEELFKLARDSGY